MSLTAVLALAGGIGMFLYGMNLLGDALSSLAGEKMESLLEKLTSSKLKGTFLGTLITGIIQSSAATCIIVLGFVNAGIMNLSQGVPVIFGANIGSTVTGQILRLGDINSQNIFLTLLKPSSFAPIIIAAGAFVLLFAKKKRTKSIGKILTGFGILFLGMSTMEQTMGAALQNNPEFEAMMMRFSNPFAGILIGMVLTAIIQSSSASVGILQALASTGVITFSTAVPIILGQNIGKCITVWLGAIGTNKKARRAAFLHTFFNVFGVLIFGAILVVSELIFADLGIWGSVMSRGNVADIHTMFNLLTALMLLPFSEPLIRLSGRMFRDSDGSDEMHRLDILDDLFIKNPPIALEQCRKVMVSTAETVKANFELCQELLQDYSLQKHNEVTENEHFLDKADTALNNYLVKIAEQGLKPSEMRSVTEMMHLIGNFERLGDYCENIAEVAEYNEANGIHFSDQAKAELEQISAASRHILEMTVQAYENDDAVVANRVEPLESVIRSLKDMLAERHIIRLQQGSCTVQAGISFVELLTNYAGIAAHCSAISLYIVQRVSGLKKFDAHYHPKYLNGEVTEEYKAMFLFYEARYCDPLDDMDGAEHAERKADGAEGGLREAGEGA